VDRIELAERRYADIVGDELSATAPGERYWRMPVSKILAWVNEYVLPAIDEVYRRPKFLDHATWPQRLLVPGAGGPHRAAVERVDQALVAEARLLHRLARNKLVARAMENGTRTHRGLCSDAVTISAEEDAATPNRVPQEPLLLDYVAGIQAMSQRNWTDLVCSDDYFVPTGGMMRTTPLPEGVTEGVFVVSLSSSLFHVGDSITRCMLQRIGAMLSFLAEFRQIVYKALRKAERAYKSQTEAEHAAHHELGQSCADLQRICFTGSDARLRDACITLVQVYATFHPAPELDWLGVSDWAIQRSQGILEHNIRSARDLETVERIAAALGDLRHLYREMTPAQSDLEAAIATGRLVLIRRGPEVYWEARRIDCDWHRHRKPWEMLWQLAANARMASPVNDIDLYQRHVSPSTMYNRWERLQSLLPASLRRYVFPGNQRATYRLQLPIHEIHLFDSGNAGP